MRLTARTLCLLVAAIIFLLVSFGVSSDKINLTGLGLFFLTVSFLLA